MINEREESKEMTISDKSKGSMRAAGWHDDEHKTIDDYRGLIAEQERVAKIAEDSHAAFAAEWTLETTKSRRVEWNGWVKAHYDEIKRDRSIVDAKQAEQGWTVAQLTNAVRNHNL